MKDYWKQHYNSNSQQFSDMLLKQVGKTINGQIIPEQQVQAIVKHVLNILQLNSNDLLVDLCCGNGLITSQLAPFVKSIIGVDFSSGLIEMANKHSAAINTNYLISDVLSLDKQILNGCKKVLLYEALQHLSKEQLSGLLKTLSNLNAGSLVLFGSIPDKAKLYTYYDTFDKFQFYQMCEQGCKPHMGRWWSKEEIERLISGQCFKMAFLPQPPSLYTAYYRFDVLLEKMT